MRREGSRCEKTEAPIEKPIAAPCSTPLSAPVSPVHPEAPLAFVRKSPCESGLARARSTGRCTLGRLFGPRVAARPPFLHCSLARATLVDARRTSRFAAASCRRVDVELANLRPWPEQVTLGRLFLLPGGARPAPSCDSLEDWTQSTMGVGSGFGPLLKPAAMDIVVTRDCKGQTWAVDTGCWLHRLAIEHAEDLSATPRIVENLAMSFVRRILYLQDRVRVLSTCSSALPCHH